ncbi:DUF2628 domain-containing protein [Varunaivibrio sulfuroxidans]|uniref:Uncharacterized protein DUF2628 n=1 Tax=Varunaivibrio sulfuroxidans TaxID=1773489 RepID=A0A4R3JG47_9PROT|nr:DUF2628 domain-containing protein [Varunaivibrio sulfuroxidans]TCS64884.1 uncharacterized protein DUF2628 [Varunaivibrio sulfuroxidans]WES29820.1 DUF2628 domain-containing protein [Varunaivibrio sulfuroxidans]
MKMFTVHYRTADRDADLILVKEGFCGPAFFFGFLWPLAHRMWTAAAVFFVAQLLVQIGAALLGLGAGESVVLSVACAAILAYLANDLRRNALRRAGYRDRAVVLGRTATDAFRRYLDRAPHDVLLALSQ